ncbi:hypothetical protein SASPL_132416 [Salvia splendens]|uniref:Xanthoxin dehydrogenase n=1 Tax=Salvia splendens TaxID=180675 RepID=A0A8X8X2Z3_SALSN|nr:hypothetical protein SASPL_132416 [Salvia splendens]
MIESTVTAYSGLDIMLSNAGVVTGFPQTVLDLDFAEYERVMRVNARGMAVCVKHAARKMVELGTRGVIICIGSVSAEKAVVNLTDYVMSKRAVLGLMRSASLQLGKHGIRVNSVSPGVKGATLTAEHVADAVAFLASDEAALLTGVDLAVDSGTIAMPFL